MKINENDHYSSSTMRWLERKVRNFTIQEDGSVDIRGDFSSTHEDFEEFPIKLGSIFGNFDISFCVNLKKLNGPTYVSDNVDFEGCVDLESLENGPTRVNGYFDITRCRSIKNLKGGPVHIGKQCIINHCTNLSSLEGIAKEILGINLEIEDCPKLKSLDFIPTIEGPWGISIKNTPIFNLLKLLKIPKLESITIADQFELPFTKELEQIIQKYLPLGDVMDCQEELIAAGFEKYARLK
jgi:hypothetical protein